jgi:hypothetical protein
MPRISDRLLLVSLVAALALSILGAGAGAALAAPKDRGDRGPKTPHSCQRAERNVQRSEDLLAEAKAAKAKAQRELNAAKKAVRKAKSKKAKAKATKRKKAKAKALREAKEAVESNTTRLADAKQEAKDAGC